MTKTLCVAGVFAALALPAAASAQDTTTPTPKESAQTTCKAERTEMGKAAFKALYGTQSKKKQNGQNAMRNCIRALAPEAEAAVAEAKTTCKAEQDADAAAFAAKYGTNKNGKNAYGKCVSSQSKETVEEDSEARVNAAKQCKAERKADAEAFATAYGTKRNAFGKCVSSKAKAQNDDEEEAPAPATTA